MTAKPIGVMPLSASRSASCPSLSSRVFPMRVDEQHVVGLARQRQGVDDLIERRGVDDDVVGEPPGVPDHRVGRRNREEVGDPAAPGLVGEQDAQVRSVGRARDERLGEPGVLDQHADDAAVGRLHVEHGSQRGPAQVRLDQDHVLSGERERRGEVDGGGALALAGGGAGDEDHLARLGLALGAGDRRPQRSVGLRRGGRQMARAERLVAAGVSFGIRARIGRR